MNTSLAFAAERLGVIMRSLPAEPHETWGVLNPGGVRDATGVMHLFPRLIAEGNYSRIGHARVLFDADKPVGVERLGIALEPHASYEVTAGGGGVEDPRVVYIARLKKYVMTYTAFVPFEPRVAVAISDDLTTWRRLGVLRYEAMEGGHDLNACGNKDATFFPDVVSDPQGIPSFAVLHRPTTRVHFRRNHDGTAVTPPPSGQETRANIWISYIPIEAALADIATLTSVRRHERVMAPQQPWEMKKIGNGAPPVRLSYAWMLTYHAVSVKDDHLCYRMGVAMLDLERPSRVVYRTPSPVLEPETDYERTGLVNNVVFPSAADLRVDGKLDVYYGAADRAIAVARFTLPDTLPVSSESNAYDDDSYDEFD